ncbi:heterogeneous nuclear ribonucleoprotein L isoform X4 [Arapaima gigas]
MAAQAGRYYNEGGRATKRQKTDNNEGGMTTEGYEDPHKTLPSPVVHVRGLVDGVMEADLVEALQEFGPISVNNVLLLTIMNPIYPITTDVLYTICNNCGPVQRIVIFRKNGVQAMVEYPLLLKLSAQRAKASLNGADIYSGCCTLKIEYAKPTRLNVFKNDQDTWDYTNPNLSGQGGPQGGYHGHYHDESYGPPPPPHYEGRRMGPPMGGPRRGGHNQRYGGPQYGHPPPPPPPGEYSPHADSPVLMVYGLEPSKMNADRVFNVFCLYGNVERVKFMKSKPGAAMVEMGDCYAVDRAITHLNNNFLFGQKLNVCVSKQQAIMPGQSYELEDGTSSFKDFHGTRNNRFTSPEQAAKNRIQHPSNVLHFFNAQPDVTVEVFTQICEELGVKSPSNIKLFTGKSNINKLDFVSLASGGGSGERSSSGLLEWESINDAMEALAMMNHYQMKNPSKFCVGATCFVAMKCTSSNGVCAFVFSRWSLPIYSQAVLLHCPTCKLSSSRWKTVSPKAPYHTLWSPFLYCL